MKKLLLALFLFATPAFGQGVVGPPYQPICNAVAQGAIVTGSSIQYVTAITGKFVYICGWHVTTGVTSSTWQMSTGTTSCPATAMTPAFTLGSTAPSADHIDFAGLATPLGQNLCITGGGTGPIQVLIYYGQY